MAAPAAIAQAGQPHVSASEADQGPHILKSPDGRATVSLTHDTLSVDATLALVRDPSVGALVLFAGTTRATSRPDACRRGDAHAFTTDLDPSKDDTPSSSYLPVASLTYHAYVPLALKTMSSIASATLDKHHLAKIAVTHRLGLVPVGEESILVAVGAAHRAEAWKGGEECLEEVKKRVEVWKREVFQGAGEHAAEWRSNERDGVLYSHRHDQG